jgi:hypothetical protein
VIGGLRRVITIPDKITATGKIVINCGLTVAGMILVATAIVPALLNGPDASKEAVPISWRELVLDKDKLLAEQTRIEIAAAFRWNDKFPRAADDWWPHNKDSIALALENAPREIRAALYDRCTGWCWIHLTGRLIRRCAAGAPCIEVENARIE